MGEDLVDIHPLGCLYPEILVIAGKLDLVLDILYRTLLDIHQLPHLPDRSPLLGRINVQQEHRHLVEDIMPGDT